MERKILFPQIDGIMHGGDYNPEQWLDRPDILEEDIRLMKKAGMNCATLGVFSWSVYEPREGEFHFKWLTDIMDKLYANGIYTILATPSGARPAWLDMKYPEAMRVDSRGMRAHHGVRHNHCMSSPIFREKVRTIDTELIKAASAHPGLIMWHISNEFGGECYCPLCVKRFQSYLADKFDNDIEKLNSAWWTTFWSHRYNSFDQIEPPFEGGEYSIMGLNLEWKRFTTWNTTDFMKSEIALLKTATPQIPVTTNFMQTYEGLDYRVMARELDVISWDSYPFLHNDYESLADTMTENSFEHAIMRSMKKNSPFMLMESAPGLVNWHNYNKLKRPGIHRLFSMQAVACGSDTVQYFQWRKGRGSYEQYHGAVIDHLGRSDTRIFKDVAELGALLSSLGELRGSVIKSRAAVIFDWNCWWAVNNMMGLAQSTKKYPETVFRAYRALLALGIDVDVISPDDDFTGYSLIVAPMLYMIDEKNARKLADFVQSGNTLAATYLTGYVDDNTLCYLGGFPGSVLKEVFGIVAEEIDTLYPSDCNHINIAGGAVVRDYAEILRTDLTDSAGLEILGRYTDDFYAGTPAVTLNKYGHGRACYIGARIDDASFGRIMELLLTEAGISYNRLPGGIEYHEREYEGTRFAFYLNYNESAVTVNGVNGHDLISNEEINGDMVIERLGVKIVKCPCITPLAARSRLTARATDAKICLWQIKHRHVQTAAVGLCRGVYVFIGWVAALSFQRIMLRRGQTAAVGLCRGVYVLIARVQPVLRSEICHIIHAEMPLRLFMDFSAGCLCIFNRNITASQEKLYLILRAALSLT